MTTLPLPEIRRMIDTALATPTPGRSDTCVRCEHTADWSRAHGLRAGAVGKTQRLVFGCVVYRTGLCYACTRLESQSRKEPLQ